MAKSLEVIAFDSMIEKARVLREKLEAKKKEFFESWLEDGVAEEIADSITKAMSIGHPRAEIIPSGPDEDTVIEIKEGEKLYKYTTKRQEYMRFLTDALKGRGFAATFAGDVIRVHIPDDCIEEVKTPSAKRKRSK